MKDKRYVLVEDGLVSLVGTGTFVGLEDEVIDFDIEGADEKRLEWVRGKDGTKARAFRKTEVVEKAKIEEDE